jgi:hypothetical protein
MRWSISIRSIRRRRSGSRSNSSMVVKEGMVGGWIRISSSSSSRGNIIMDDTGVGAVGLMERIKW